MNNYNKNKELIILIMKFKKYNNQYPYKWETNYWIYVVFNLVLREQS